MNDIDIELGFIFWRPDSASYLKPFEDYIWEAWERKTFNSSLNCRWMILK